MRTSDFQRLARSYEDKAEEARLEMANAIKERDLVCTEIREQREWVKEVSSILYRKQAKKWDAIVLLNALSNDIKYQRNSGWMFMRKSFLSTSRGK